MAARKAKAAAPRPRTAARKPKAKPVRRPKDPSGQRLADGRPVATASTFSPRLHAARDELERNLRRLFPGVERITAYNMHGWRVRRPVRIVDWPGTMDPNWVQVFVAERKQGVTVHVWNPYDYDAFRRHAAGLQAAGFKPMVGCVQYNRKGEVPVAALLPVLEGIARRMEQERTPARSK